MVDVEQIVYGRKGPVNHPEWAYSSFSGATTQCKESLGFFDPGNDMDGN